MSTVVNATPEAVIDVFAESYQRAPYAQLAEARRHGRFARDAFGSRIPLHAADFEALAGDRRFAAFGDRLARMLGMESGPAYDWLSGSLMFLNDPEHTRLRGLVRNEFTPARVATMREGLLRTTDRLLDAMLPAGRAEFMDEFASRLPLMTVCQLLGVPVDDWRSMRDWSSRLLPNNASEIADADVAVAEFRAYVEDLLRVRRSNPQDDLLTALARAQAEGSMSEDELWILVVLLVFAGNDTTMGLLTNGLYLLLQHPDQLRLLRSDPGRYIDGAIEEILRFEPPVSGNGRIALEDVRLDGLDVLAGDEFRLMPVAVNRDPERFAEPDRFDITRSPNRHLAFGWGTHMCLGAVLARMEARVAIPRILERLDGLALTDQGATWAPTRGRTLERLAVTFEPDSSPNITSGADAAQGVGDAPAEAEPDPHADIHVRVDRRQVGAEGVAVFDLVALDGGELPAWEPGAHIDVVLDDGHTRQYSLCGDPADRSTWRIGVLREVAGRGGSRFIHDELHEGVALVARGPRNQFPLVDSPAYVFIAGGIGITPVLPMIRAAEAAGSTWELHYGGRSRATMAFLGTWAADDPRVHIHPQDEVGLIDLEAILGTARSDTAVYCCGPEPLLAAVERSCEAWPAGSLHVERFAPKAVAAPVLDVPFEIELAQTGITLTVPPDRTVLQVLEDAGADVFSSCQEGTCGTCETGVLAGEVDHRDSLLTDDEKARNDVMYVCVSRAACPKLTLDL